MVSFACAFRQKSMAFAPPMSSGYLACRSFAKLSTDAGTEALNQPSFYGRFSSHLRFSQHQRKTIFAASFRMCPGTLAGRSARYAAHARVETSKLQSFYGRLSSHLHRDDYQTRLNTEVRDHMLDAQPRGERVTNSFHERLSSYLSPGHLQHEMKYLSRLQLFNYVSHMNASARGTGESADSQ